jgi:hypothetical protein
MCTERSVPDDLGCQDHYRALGMVAQGTCAVLLALSQPRSIVNTRGLMLGIIWRRYHSLWYKAASRQWVGEPGAHPVAGPFGPSRLYFCWGLGSLAAERFGPLCQHIISSYIFRRILNVFASRWDMNTVFGVSNCGPRLPTSV